MSNYQILEIALDVAFFATVASVMVIFAIVRERHIRKTLTTESRTTPFPEVLAEAASPAPSIEEITGDPVKKSSRKRILKRVEPEKVIPTGNRRLSRSEAELMGSLSSEATTERVS